MALTRNEIRKRLAAFAKEQQNASNERSQAQTFWLRFYECFGIRAESATIYEQSVKKLGGAPGFIDSFIPGKLIVEHKSKGKDLDAAFDQASEYFLSLKEEDRPRYIITSDFARIRIYDLRTGGGYHQCKLAELSKKADWFMFLVEGELTDYTEESEADRNAAYTISKLHESLLRANFKGRDLEVLLTRLLFCLFAEDTGIFGENGIFRRLMESTRADGSNVGRVLAELFQVLNTPEDDRQNNLDENLARFAYINGALFAESTRIPSFDSTMREQLIACAKLDWSGISPAIFGAMFQGVLEEHNPDGADSSNRKASRRELGAHYTSERNILRVINPLCMDDLRAELAKVKRNKKLLQAFYDKLPTLTFFDPACGCGNFLVIGFRELRQLEMDTIEAMTETGQTKGGLLDVSTLCRVKVNQFYGIEIDESAAHIARVAMWITDHQMNLEAAERFGTTRPTVPLVDSATIICENSLRIDWNDVIPAEQCSYVLGNPPFIGAKYLNDEQREDVAHVMGNIPSSGLLDYVTCWYVKALPYIHANPSIHVAFVSTNSITQGEQVAVLWSHMLGNGVKIHFAHRTFQWSNEGKGVAAVHCVIVGFGLNESKQHTIFDYTGNIKGEPNVLSVRHINPYLVDAPDVVMGNRQTPLCNAPEIGIGNKPIDGGNYLFTPEEKDEFIKREPQSARWFRRWIGAVEFINGYERWCLWLGDCPPNELRKMPEAMKRVEAVREFRLASKSAPTQKLAATPTRFHVEYIPNEPYLLIPRVSSERRAFVPIGFMQPDTLTSDTSLTVPNATLYHFGILISTMQNAWMRATAGRLESRYRYSAGIVYNNFPWPESTDKHHSTIEVAAQAILDARARYPESSLADLYDPLSMPPELVKAHAALDKAVDAAYQYKCGKDDAARVAFLFERYQQLTSLLPTVKAKKARKRKA
ncbi:MAG: class I SAM-dependent DNA methyltransferase [Pseudomonadota bacterium]